MEKETRFVVKSGNRYRTWLGGYTENIDKAVYVGLDIPLSRKQKLVKIEVCITKKEVGEVQ